MRFVLDTKDVSELVVQTLLRIVELSPHTADIHARKDGRDYHWEADWLKYLKLEDPPSI